MKPIEEIIADFDAIAEALAAGSPRDTLTSAEQLLLEHLTPGVRIALDVGCGDGVVTRALARRGARVIGVDVSPRMIALARARTPAHLDVDYRTADFMSGPFPASAFDAVVCVNMVHHFPLAEVVGRLADVVAPGGTLLIQDVVTRVGVRYLAPNIAGAIRRRVDSFLARGPAAPGAEALYQHHGKNERYLTPIEADGAYRTLLPGVRIEHHLEWRYSAIWTRPLAA